MADLERLSDKELIEQVSETREQGRRAHQVEAHEYTCALADLAVELAKRLESASGALARQDDAWAWVAMKVDAFICDVIASDSCQDPRSENTYPMFGPIAKKAIALRKELDL